MRRSLPRRLNGRRLNLRWLGPRRRICWRLGSGWLVSAATRRRRLGCRRYCGLHGDGERPGNGSSVRSGRNGGVENARRALRRIDVDHGHVCIAHSPRPLQAHERWSHERKNDRVPQGEDVLTRGHACRDRHVVDFIQLRCAWFHDDREALVVTRQQIGRANDDRIGSGVAKSRLDVDEPRRGSGTRGRRAHVRPRRARDLAERERLIVGIRCGQCLAHRRRLVHDHVLGLSQDRCVIVR